MSKKAPAGERVAKEEIEADPILGYAALPGIATR